jgi:hypothetical protein
MNEGCGDLIHDSCGMNDGKLIGAAPMSGTSGWVPGPHGGALAFGGVNDYVDCGNGPVLNNSNLLTVVTQFSYSSSGSYPFVVSKALDPTHGSWGLIISNANRPRLLTWEAGVLKGGDYTGGPTFPVNTNGQVVGRYDGINIDTFINAQLAKSIPWVGTIDVTAYPVRIGTWGSLSQLLPGRISSVSIYNRALSAEEIAYLYAFPWCMYDHPASAWEYNQQNRNFDHYYRRLMAA